jgi:hypothetical protein
MVRRKSEAPAAPLPVAAGAQPASVATLLSASILSLLPWTIDRSGSYAQTRKQNVASIIAYIACRCCCVSVVSNAPAFMREPSATAAVVSSTVDRLFNAPSSVAVTWLTEPLRSSATVAAISFFIFNGCFFSLLAAAALKVLVWGQQYVQSFCTPTHRNTVSAAIAYVVTAELIFATIYFFYINCSCKEQPPFVGVACLVAVLSLTRLLHAQLKALKAGPVIWLPVDCFVVYLATYFARSYFPVSDISILTGIVWTLSLLSLLSVATTCTVFTISQLDSMAPLFALLLLPGVPLRRDTVTRLFEIFGNNPLSLGDERFYIFMTAEQASAALRNQSFRAALLLEQTAGNVPIFTDRFGKNTRMAVHNAPASRAEDANGNPTGGSSIAFTPNNEGLPAGVSSSVKSLSEIRNLAALLNLECYIIGIKPLPVLLFITSFFFPGIFSTIPGMRSYSSTSSARGDVGEPLTTNHSIFTGEWTRAKWNPWGQLFNFGWWPAFFALAFNFNTHGFLLAVVVIGNWWIIVIFHDCIYPILIVIFYSTVIGNPLRANTNAIRVAADLTCTLIGGSIGGLDHHARCAGPTTCGCWHANVWCGCGRDIQPNAISENVHLTNRNEWYCRHGYEQPKIRVAKLDALKIAGAATLGSQPLTMLTRDQFERT